MRGRQKNHTVLILFSLLLICSTSSAAPSVEPTWYGNIYLWMAFSLIISASFIALAYMASKLFELQVLDAWVKVELSELATSMLIAVFCIVLIASVNTAAQFLSGESGATNVVDAARSYLQHQVYEDGREIYNKVGGVYFNVARIASYSYTAGASVGVTSISYSSAPASGLSSLVGQIGQGMDAVANFMLLASAQSAFLKFFQSASVVMLPVGIFLRSFSLTRKIGGVLLAATIASAVIYPASFLVSREVYQIYSPEMMAGAQNIHVTAAENPPAANIICNPYMQRFVQSPIPFIGGEMGWTVAICIPLCVLTVWGYAFCMETCGAVVYTTFYIIKSVFPILVFFLSLLPFANMIGDTSDLLVSYYDPLSQWALPTISKYAVLSLVNFLIPLIITMVMLRNLAIAFGGEPQLYGLSKLI